MRATPTIFACLGYLMEGPASGYDTLKAVREGSLRPFLSAGQAAIYEGLRSLEKAGALVSEQVMQSEKPNKVVYAVTGEGKALFSRLAARLLASDQSFLTALLIVRFHRFLPVDQVIDALDRQEAVLEAQKRSIAGLNLSVELAKLAPVFKDDCKKTIDAQVRFVRDLRVALIERN